MVLENTLKYIKISIVGGRPHDGRKETGAPTEGPRRPKVPNRRN